MNFDIAIIGASSSGLYAAALLARAGKRVAVFERSAVLAPARRTYIITPHIHQFLDEISGEALLCHTRVMAVETRQARVEIPFSQPDLIIERNALTQSLLVQAQAAGAEIFWGHRFAGFGVGSPPKLIFETDTGEVSLTTKAVIGADGFKSAVAQAAGIALPPVVPIVQAEVALPGGWNPSVTKVWFEIEDTPYFYWLIPESEDRGVLGLVGEDSAQTRQLLEVFLAKQNLKPLAFQASQVAMHRPGLRPWTRIGSLPILLVGDAAGQVKVTTVGGTVTGFWGAQAAAASLLNGTSYARELRPLKRELDLHWFIRLMLERLDAAGYDRLVNCITPRVQAFLSQRNRDQMAGAFWQLPFREPRLIWLGIRLLLRI